MALNCSSLLSNPSVEETIDLNLIKIEPEDNSIEETSCFDYYLEEDKFNLEFPRMEVGRLVSFAEDYDEASEHNKVREGVASLSSSRSKTPPRFRTSAPAVLPGVMRKSSTSVQEIPLTRSNWFRLLTRATKWGNIIRISTLIMVAIAAMSTTTFLAEYCGSSNVPRIGVRSQPQRHMSNTSETTLTHLVDVQQEMKAVYEIGKLYQTHQTQTQELTACQMTSLEMLQKTELLEEEISGLRQQFSVRHAEKVAQLNHVISAIRNYKQNHICINISSTMTFCFYAMALCGICLSILFRHSIQRGFRAFYNRRLL